jgi:hypothetical protein
MQNLRMKALKTVMLTSETIWDVRQEHPFDVFASTNVHLGTLKQDLNLQI